MKARIMGLAVVLVLTGCPPSEYSPAVDEPEPSVHVVQIAADLGLTTFVELVDRAGMRATLGRAGPFTVFAPTDEAFAAHADLDPTDPSELEAVLSLHVVTGELRMPDLLGERSETTLGGHTLTIIANDEIFVEDPSGEVAIVQPVEYIADNGVVYVIDRVLQPVDAAVAYAGAAGAISTRHAH